MTAILPRTVIDSAQLRSVVTRAARLGSDRSMPFLLLLLIALAVGSLVTVLAAHYPHTAGVSQPSDRAAQRIGHTIAARSSLRPLLHGRLDPATATGLGLSIALLVIFVAGLVVGALAYSIRSSSALADIDRGVGQWGVDHSTGWSTRALEAVTWLGDTQLVVVLAVLVGVVEYRRRPSHWIGPFLVLVIGGQVFLTSELKDMLDRVRPEFNPVAETLGPSFPSGHSALAAAFFGAVALLASRGRPATHRSAIFGVAAALAAGVACSRVMLGVHWLTDVVAGVLFGWAWFSACSIAFGGRMLRFGATAREASRVAEDDLRATPPQRPEPRSSHDPERES
jgi:membrane-associated phospholipid phosphatase